MAAAEAQVRALELETVEAKRDAGEHAWMKVCHILANGFLRQDAGSAAADREAIAEAAGELLPERS